MSTNNSDEIKTAPRKKFRRHPLVKDLLTLPHESDDYQRIATSIKEDGILDPLKCVEENGALLVLDGIHRLAIAQEMELAELPYRIVADQELIAVICGSAMRAGWTKSALAYRMWPLFEAMALTRGGNRGNQHKKVPKGNDFPLATSAEIAARLGVSEKLVDQAKRAHAYFTRHPAKRKELEPLLLTGEYPLHKIGQNGANGRNGGHEKPGVLLILDRLKPLPASFDKWEKMDRDARSRATNVFIETVLKLPDEIQEATLDALEVKLRS
jgi:hypothetical protein